VAAYWEHFGEILGMQVKPLPVPQTLEGVTLRAVAIKPQYASRLLPLDLDIVAQQVDLENGQAFDLVIGTNIFVYYDWFRQALAMASIARMMNPGGVFLTNDTLSAHHVQSLEFLDRHTVSFATNGPYGDNVLVYRRR
jgi:chemotaxis methyl-accepting protein methylase